MSTFLEKIGIATSEQSPDTRGKALPLNTAMYARRSAAMLFITSNLSLTSTLATTAFITAGFAKQAFDPEYASGVRVPEDARTINAYTTIAPDTTIEALIDDGVNKGPLALGVMYKIKTTDTQSGKGSLTLKNNVGDTFKLDASADGDVKYAFIPLVRTAQSAKMVITPGTKKSFVEVSEEAVSTEREWTPSEGPVYGTFVEAENVEVSYKVVSFNYKPVVDFSRAVTLLTANALQEATTGGAWIDDSVVSILAQ